MPEESASTPIAIPPSNSPSLLDKPVPNPLAKNPNVYTHKVFASVGLILIGAIVATAGIWWYVENQSGSKIPEDEITTTKVSTSSANSKNYKTSEIFGKKGNVSSEKLDSSNWKEYKTMYFSFSYPPDFTVGNEYKNGIRLLSGDYKFNQEPNVSGDYYLSGTDVSITYDTASLESYDTFDEVAEDRRISKEGVSVLDYILLDHQNAMRSTWKGEWNTNKYEILAVKDKRVFYLIQSFPGNQQDLDTSVLDTIVTTFKFL